jgi:7-cyano-7-deazaguanine synthase in queuosine biosynthesis
MNYFPLPPEAQEIPLDDYTGVLAFSGGVESTALMAWAKARGEKIVAFNLVISLPKPPFGPIEMWMAKQRINAKLIAAKLDVPLIALDMQMTNLNTIRHDEPDYQNRSLQVHYIMWYLGLLHIYNPGLTNLYYGLNNTDKSAIDPVAKAKLEAVLKLMTGESKMCTPLDKLSKKEQWDLIPPDVQPLVLTCYNKVCGDCFKCQERIDAGIPLK